MNIKLITKEDGTTGVLLNGQELETVDSLVLTYHPDEEDANFRVTLIVPEVNIHSEIEHVDLSTESFKKCEKCGKFIIPNIDKNLDETEVVAKYDCFICDWHKEYKVQNWNNGIKKVSSMPDGKQ